MGVTFLDEEPKRGGVTFLDEEPKRGGVTFLDEAPGSPPEGAVKPEDPAAGGPGVVRRVLNEVPGVLADAGRAVVAAAREVPGVLRDAGRAVAGGGQRAEVRDQRPDDPAAAAGPTRTELGPVRREVAEAAAPVGSDLEGLLQTPEDRAAVGRVEMVDPVTAGVTAKLPKDHPSVRATWRPPDPAVAAKENQLQEFFHRAYETNDKERAEAALREMGPELAESTLRRYLADEGPLALAQTLPAFMAAGVATPLPVGTGLGVRALAGGGRMATIEAARAVGKPPEDIAREALRGFLVGTTFSAGEGLRIFTPIILAKMGMAQGQSPEDAIIDALGVMAMGHALGIGGRRRGQAQESGRKDAYAEARAHRDAGRAEIADLKARARAGNIAAREELARRAGFGSVRDGAAVAPAARVGATGPATSRGLRLSDGLQGRAVDGRVSGSSAVGAGAVTGLSPIAPGASPGGVPITPPGGTLPPAISTPGTITGSNGKPVPEMPVRAIVPPEDLADRQSRLEAEAVALERAGDLKPVADGWVAATDKGRAWIEQANGPETAPVVGNGPSAPVAGPEGQTGVVTLPGARAPAGSGPVVVDAQSTPDLLGPAEAEGMIINRFPLNSVAFDPFRFQYKLGSGQKGETGSLKGVKVYDKVRGGVISVWRDPANGKVYVVNGHNRAAAALRLGVESHAVQFLKAETDVEARALGALINISEGRGSVVDAAKFFRDSSGHFDSSAAIERLGLPISESKVTRGLALSKLNETLFNKVVRGEIEEGLGVVVGEQLPSHSDQAQMMALLESRRAPLSLAVVRELAELAKSVPTKVDTQAELFPTSPQEKKLLIEKARVIAAVNRKLSSDKALFGRVASTGAAERLGIAGNVIDAETNRAISQEAAVLQYVFQQLKHTEMSDLLNEAAKEVSNGKPVQKVIEGIFPRVKEKVSAALGRANDAGGPGVPAHIGNGNTSPGEAGPQAGAVREAPSLYDAEGREYAGDLFGDAAGESAIHRSLRLVVESKAKQRGQPGSIDVMAGRALQQKAEAILTALDSGGMSEDAAEDAWVRAQGIIQRGTQRLKARMRVELEQGEMFGEQAGPKPGMLFESAGEYGVDNLTPERIIAEGQQAEFEFLEGVTNEELKQAAAARGVKPREQDAAARDDAARLKAVSNTSRDPYLGPGPASESAPPSASKVPGLTAAKREAQGRALSNPESAEVWPEAFAAGDTVTSIIADRIRRPDARGWNVRGVRIASPADAAALHMSIDAGTQEVFAVSFVDANMRTIETRIVTVGILNGSLVSPREVLGMAPHGTVGVVTTHNHPSGDPTPSGEDLRITGSLQKAAQLAGIPLLDHVVTNAGRYYSMREEGVRSFDAVRARRKGVVRESEFIEGPGMPDRYDWEAVPRRNLTKIGSPEDVARIARAMSQHWAPGQYDLILYLSTKNQLNAVTRVPAGKGAAKINREIARNGKRHGAGGVIVVLQGGDGPETRAVLRGLQDGAQALDTSLVDALFGPDLAAATGEQKYVSARKQGLIAEAGAVAAPAGAVKEAPDGPVFRRRGAVAANAASFGGPGAFEVGDRAQAAPGPADDRSFSVFRVELPELIALSRDLMQGRYPKVKDSLRALRGQAAGVAGFTPGIRSSLDMELRRDLFNLVAPGEVEGIRAAAKKELLAAGLEDGSSEFLEKLSDLTMIGIEQARQKALKEHPKTAAAVVAHELYHLVDFLPEVMLKRGNVLGHIAAWKKSYLQATLPLTPGGLERALEPDERKALRRQAEKQVGKRPNRKKRQAEYKAWLEDVKVEYAKALKAELEARGLVARADVIAELEGLVAWWHNEATAPSYYTEKPEELFAEAGAVLLNNPAAVAKRAPIFYELTMNYLTARPEWQAAYKGMMQAIERGDHKKERVRNLIDSVLDATDSAAESEKALRKMSRRQTVDGFLYTFHRAFGPVEWRLKRISRRGGRPKTLSALKEQLAAREAAGETQGWIERHLYRNALDERYLGRVRTEVVKPLVAAGMDAVPLWEFMFHKHVVENRFDLANPYGWTAAASSERLAEMKRELGPEKWAVLVRQQEAYWQVRREEVIDLIRDQGVYDKELMGKLYDRRGYVTISAVEDRRAGAERDLDTIAEMMGARYGGQVSALMRAQKGYLGNIKNPFLATMEKDLRLMHFAIRERLKREIVGTMLNSEFAGEWAAADERWNAEKKCREVIERSGPKFGTLMFLENGKLKGYYGPRSLVQEFQQTEAIQLAVLAKVSSALSRPFQVLFTQMNYGFWAVNSFRDKDAFRMQMPGARLFGKRSFHEFRKIGKAAAKSSLRGEPDAVALEMLKRGVWVSQAQRGGNEYLEDPIDRMLTQYSFSPVEWGDPAAARKIGYKLRQAFHHYMMIGSVSERTTKAAAMLYLDKHFPGMPEWQKLQTVHEMGGSPNFLAKGRGNWAMNVVWPFYNPAKEGVLTGLKVIRDRPGEAFWKYLKWVFLPALALEALRRRWLTDRILGPKKAAEIAELVNSIPRHDMDNYRCVPLGWADYEQRKVAYLRIPMNQFTQFQHGLTAKILRADEEGFSTTTLFNVAGGQVPGLNPLLSVGTAWTQYLTTGRAPYDMFRGQYIIPETVAEAGGAEALAGLGAYTWNQLGGGIITRLDVGPDRRDRRTMFERILAMPVISGSVGRFIKVSNRGIADSYADLQKQVRSARAKENIEVRRLAGEQPEDMYSRILEMGPHGLQRLKFEMGQNIKAEALGPYENAMLDAKSLEERGALMEEMSRRRARFVP